MVCREDLIYGDISIGQVALEAVPLGILYDPVAVDLDSSVTCHVQELVVASAVDVLLG